MNKFIAAASIGQLRDIVSHINRTTNFIGLDENGEAIYDPSIKKPCLKFKGTVKLHGTFSSVCYNSVSGIWFQSKNNIITPIKDNAGFALFANTKKDIFKELISKLANQHDIDLTNNTISLGMEWVGKGIQRGVSISLMDKSAFIFGQAKVTPFNEELPAYWIGTNKIDSIDDKIYNIENFKTYSIEVDFNQPLLAQNKIIDMTIEVENECPVAKEFGHLGIGEGIVFTHLNEDGTRHIFKSKGEKHAGVSKVKTLKKVDDVKINKTIEVAEKVTPNWRLEQMMTETCDLINGGSVDRSKLGNYIRAVISDVMKEDLVVITDAGLEPSDVNKYISKIARDYFFQFERENLSL
jgi:hypothetical protein